MKGTFALSYDPFTFATLARTYFTPGAGAGVSSIGYIVFELAIVTSNRSDGLSPTVSMLYTLRCGTCTKNPLEATNGSWPSIVKRICPSWMIHHTRLSGWNRRGVFPPGAMEM